MTTVTRAVTPSSSDPRGTITFSWTSAAMDSDDDGAAVGLDPRYEYSVQLIGALGTSGSLTMRGSFDGGTTWGALKDPASQDITLGAIGKIMKIDTYAPLVKPVVTAGDGSTALQVVMIGILKPC